MFPKLPLLGNIRKFWSGLRFYYILHNIVEERTKAGRAENDPLQVRSPDHHYAHMTRFYYP